MDIEEKLQHLLNRPGFNEFFKPPSTRFRNALERIEVDSHSPRKSTPLPGRIVPKWGNRSSGSNTKGMSPLT